MQSLPDLYDAIPDDMLPEMRFFFHGEPEPTDWGTWFISPTDGYWELQGYGPFRIKDVQKCQICFLSINDEIVQRLKDMGFFEEERGLFTKMF